VYFARLGSELAIGGHNLVNNSGEVKSGSSRHSAEILVWSIKVLKHPIFSVQIHSQQILLDKENLMDNRDWIENVDEEMEASNEERKRLALRVNSLSSTTTFTLDTLIQHRVLIGQLQDEVDFLRRQLVSLQIQIAQRNEEPGNSSSVAGQAGGEATEVGILSDLNAPVEVVEDQEQPENDFVPEKTNNT
jgi:hypothetical protein